MHWTFEAARHYVTDETLHFWRQPARDRNGTGSRVDVAVIMRNRGNGSPLVPLVPMHALYFYRARLVEYRAHPITAELRYRRGRGSVGVRLADERDQKERSN